VGEHNLKGVEAPSTLVMVLLFVVILAIIVLLIAYFKVSVTNSTGFKNYTNLSYVLKWG
jgi:uncharacterized membrane protein YedE/YeeE